MPTPEVLTSLTAKILAEMHDDYWGTAFTQLAALPNELTAEQAWLVIKYAPRAQTLEDRSVVRIPESTARERRENDQSVPSVKTLGHVDPPDPSTTRGERCGVVDTRFGTPSPEIERENLLPFARTRFEKDFCWLAMQGYDNAEAAEELRTTLTRTRRTETILRTRAGFEPHPRGEQ